MLDARDRNLAVGFSCGVFACVLWGLVYLVPLALPDYDPIYITAGRFVSFGLVAVPLIWLERYELACYSAADWWYVTKLGVIGNIVYYWTLASCIQYAGAPLAGMCMAVIPVSVAVIANWRDRKRHRALPWKKLAPGLVLVVVGFILANSGELDVVTRANSGDSLRFWIGCAFGLAALFLWTWYPIRNADWLTDHPKRSPRTWSTAQGLVTMPFALLLYLVYWYIDPTQTEFLGARPLWFIFVAAGSGLVCSWMGIAFWNAMSQRLPTALAGQMIVFETIFAVIFAHIWRGEWPTLTMVAGLSLLLAGVLVSMAVFRAARL